MSTTYNRHRPQAFEEFISRVVTCRFVWGRLVLNSNFLREYHATAAPVIRVARRPTPEQAEMLNYMYVVH